MLLDAPTAREMSRIRQGKQRPQTYEVNRAKEAPEFDVMDKKGRHRHINHSADPESAEPAMLWGAFCRNELKPAQQHARQRNQCVRRDGLRLVEE